MNNNSNQEFSDKVVVITGASMGIGKACASSFAAHGAKVVVADIDHNAGNRCVTEIQAAGGVALFVATDVSDMQQVHNMAKRTADEFGGVDILVNNAAKAIGGAAHEIDESQWHETLSINLGGFWRTLKVCVPSMIERGGGAIINMSSTQSMRGFKGWAAYAAAKGGINALTQQTAVELAPHGIRVNAIAPGTIMTPMNERIFANAENPEELKKTWNDAHPLGRYGQPHEVADAALFLASDRASFITGEILRVDGGQVVRGE